MFPFQIFRGQNFSGNSAKVEISFMSQLDRAKSVSSVERIEIVKEFFEASSRYNGIYNWNYSSTVLCIELV